MNVRTIEVPVKDGEGSEGVLEIKMVLLEGYDHTQDIGECIKIISADMYKGREKTSLDIDLGQVYSVLSSAIREAGLNAMFNEEDGGF